MKKSIDTQREIMFPVELDFTRKAPINKGVIKDSYSPIFSINSYRDNSNPLLFLINTSSDYIDLKSSFLHLQVVIQKSDGTNLATTDSVSLCHNAAAAFFENIEILFQNIAPTRPINLYPYVGHIHDLLHRTNEIDLPALKSSFFYPDSGVKMDSTNSGFEARESLCSLSKVIDLVCKIHHPLFQQSRPLLPNTQLQISLTRSSPQFILTGKDIRSSEATQFPYKVVLQSATLYIRKLTLHADLIKSHQSLLVNKRISYPLKFYNIHQIPIPSSTLNFQSDVFNIQSLPNFIILTFIDMANLTSKLTNSCYEFNNFAINNVVLNVETSHQSFQVKTDLDITNNKFSLAYQMTAALFKQFGSPYSVEDFCGRNFFLALELAPRFNPNAINLTGPGQIQLQLGFKSALSSSICALLYMENEGEIILGKNEIIPDYLKP